MTKENISLILDKLESIHSYDRKINQAWKDFIWVLAPSEYAPIMEWRLNYIFSILKVLYPEITELLEYYFYESKNMDWWCMIESDGKTYNYANKDEIIQSMIDFWYITN